MVEEAVRDSGAIPNSSWIHYVDHVLACDNDKRAQQWIMKSQTPKHYLPDISEAGDSVFFDTVSGQFIPAPQAEMAICSWSCVDVCLDMMLDA